MTLGLHQSDDEYTTGVRLAGVHTIEPGQKGPLHTLRPFTAAPERCFTWRWEWGMSLYTPTNLLTPNLITSDRPYAGWMYVSYGLNAYDVAPVPHQPPSVTSVRTAQSFDVYVGIVGPHAYGEFLQNTAHKLFNVRVYPDGPIKLAQGWANQLKDEPAFYVQYRRTTKRKEGLTSAHWRYADIANVWEGTAGSVFTYGGLGAVARLGYNLSDDLSNRPISLVQAEPSASHDPVATTARYHSTHASSMGQGGSASECPSWLRLLVPSEAYLFTNPQARLVLRNEFLDGSLFRESPQTVTKEPVVADLDTGAVLRWRPFKVTYRAVIRSSEFRIHAGPHFYGSLAVSYDTRFSR